MRQRVIVMNFDENAKAYQAFCMIKKAQMEKKIAGEQMAVINHSEDGQHKFAVEDFIDFTGTNQTSKGGVIGMLRGVLGGGRGWMWGWVGGGMDGGADACWW